MNSGHERSRSSVQRGGVWGGFAGSKSFPMRYFTVLNAVALNSLSEMKTTDDPSQWDQLEHTFRPKDPPAYFILKYSHVIDKPRSRFWFQIFHCLPILDVCMFQMSVSDEKSRYSKYPWFRVDFVDERKCKKYTACSSARVFLVPPMSGSIS